MIKEAVMSRLPSSSRGGVVGGGGSSRSRCQTILQTATESKFTDLSGIEDCNICQSQEFGLPRKTDVGDVSSGGCEVEGLKRLRVLGFRV